MTPPGLGASVVSDGCQRSKPASVVLLAALAVRLAAGSREHPTFTSPSGRFKATAIEEGPYRKLRLRITDAAGTVIFTSTKRWWNGLFGGVVYEWDQAEHLWIESMDVGGTVVERGCDGQWRELALHESAGWRPPDRILRALPPQERAIMRNALPGPAPDCP